MLCLWPVAISSTFGRADGYKQPVIEESLNPDRITLTLQIDIDSNERNNDRYERENGKNLSENETLVLETLHSDSHLSAAQVSLKQDYPYPL